ncbi:MAG: hypothetical protein L0287_16510 [Anaerolineae bacterium]|nr:hypothetical protein [Anaerolineae bacterium]
MERFHWSLYDIDETDIESLIPFVFEYARWKAGNIATGRRQMYADEVDWL